MDSEIGFAGGAKACSEIEARFVEAGSWSFEANWRGKIDSDHPQAQISAV